MKRNLDRYCKHVEKKTDKILLNMFGIKGIVEAIKHEEELEKEIEKSTNKSIELVDFTDVRNNEFLMINFCEYKTINSILNTYFDSRRTHMFGNDYIWEVEHDCR